jgi:hypothetical protein
LVFTEIFPSDSGCCLADSSKNALAGALHSRSEPEYIIKIASIQNQITNFPLVEIFRVRRADRLQPLVGGVYMFFGLY